MTEDGGRRTENGRSLGKQKQLCPPSSILLPPFIYQKNQTTQAVSSNNRMDR